MLMKHYFMSDIQSQLANIDSSRLSCYKAIKIKVINSINLQNSLVKQAQVYQNS